MRPVSRKPVSKSVSARSFRGQSRTVAAANTRNEPMRGGWRL